MRIDISNYIFEQIYLYVDVEVILINTWLFTWNPEKWAWDSRLNGYAETKHEIETIGRSYIKWSCGVNQGIRSGDRIYLIRLGKDPRGIVASGYALSDVFEGAHWDEGKAEQGKRVRRVWIKLDKMAGTNFEDILSLERLLELSPEYCWTPQASGIGINEDLAKAVQIEWRSAPFNDPISVYLWMHSSRT